MVRSVDYILKNKFQIPKGLGRCQKITIKNPNNSQETQEVHQVLILDPAVGTGTFYTLLLTISMIVFVNRKGCGLVMSVNIYYPVSLGLNY